MEEITDPLLLQELRNYNYRLRNLRKQKGYSQKVLGELVDVSYAVIGLYERLQSIPPEITRVKIANVLETTTNYLFPETLLELIRIKFPHKLIGAVSESKLLRYVENERLRLESASSPERKLLLEDRTQVIDNVLSILSSREKEVIKMYYGLGYDRTYSFDEIGEKFDLTHERIRQIKEKAIGRLRYTSRSKILFEYIDI